MMKPARSLNLTRSVVGYTGAFAEPAFELIGNPAALYRLLLRHLGSFGATISSLSIDVSELSRARVSCRVSDDLLLAVSVQGVEVMATFTGQQDLETAIRFTEASRTAVHKADPSLEIVRQHVINHLWGRVQGATFREFAAMLVPGVEGPGFDALNVNTLAWSDQLRGTQFSLEQGEHDQDGIFVRSTATFPPDASLHAMAVSFKQQLRSRLSAVGLNAGEVLS